jgi:deazaflavin-dependent oxidoreductase (nitroreductase family)
MRKVRWSLAIVAVAAQICAAAVWLWTRNRRMGTKLMNETVNRFLLSRGLAGGRASEIATLEHFGRKSGTRRLTLIHPEPTDDGIRIMAPVGEQSEWARNVLAAGRCRIQWHGRVYELDEPRMVAPATLTDLSPLVRRVTDALGFRYVLLHRFADAPGDLEPREAPAPEAPTPEPVMEKVQSP